MCQCRFRPLSALNFAPTNQRRPPREKREKKRVRLKNGERVCVKRVCEREGKRERETEVTSSSVTEESESENVCVSMCERKRIFVFVREREREEEERKREGEREESTMTRPTDVIAIPSQ